MAGQKHDHKYSRKKLGKDGDWIVMACVLPDCTHYLHYKLAIGKKTICFSCGETFNLTAKDIKLKPTCTDCKPVVTEDDVEIAAKVMKNLGIH